MADAGYPVARSMPYDRLRHISVSDRHLQLTRTRQTANSGMSAFTYPFGDGALTKIRLASLAEGRQLLADSQPAQAVEPLRKAYGFCR
jgi:hypothetical protein